jgi:hypothetical protein
MTGGPGYRRDAECNRSTFCGQAASGDCCRANFHRVARSIIISSLTKLRCAGPSTSSALRAGPSSCRTGSLSADGDHGWPIGQDDRAWWRSWFRRAQARKRTQTPHLGRHTWPTGCQPCRTGGHIRWACGRSAAWRIDCVVSENPDYNSRCRPRKPLNPLSNTKDSSYGSLGDDKERSRSRV